MIYRFGEFELDDEHFTLSQHDRTRHVEPLIFDLLLFLVRHANEVVSRDRLMDGVWKGRIVSDTTISGSIKDARKVLGDTGDKQAFIRTVRGRGFTFVAPVDMEATVTRIDISDSVEGHSARSDAMPTLVVRPFNIFPDADTRSLSSLAESFVQNLVTVLTRIPLLKISTLRSIDTSAHPPDLIAGTHRESESDFVIEGSLQRTGSRVSINIQLIDADGGFHLWAQRFDCNQDEHLVDGWLNNIVGVLEPQLIRGVMERLRGNGDALNSKQLLLRAMGLLSLRGWHRDTFVESTDLLRKALEQDPELALGRAYLSLMLGLGHRVGLLEKSNAVAADAEREAEHALRLDSFDSTVLSLSGCALADIGQPERALPILENSIAINPYNGHAWAALGSAEAMLKQHDSAIEHLRQGIDISPADSRRAVWAAMLSIACLQSGDLDAARTAALEGIRYDDRNYLPRIAHAGIALCQRNRQDAIRALKNSLRVKPDLSRSEVDGMVGKKLGNHLWRLMGTTP